MTGYTTPIDFTREAWTGERRVTVDLDDTRPLDIVRAHKFLERAGGYDIEARVSSSGEGAHVRAWFDADDVDAETVERLRLAAGDHPRRVWMDREHKTKPQQVLFSRKWSGEAGEWYSDPWRAVDELMRRTDRRPELMGVESRRLFG